MSDSEESSNVPTLDMAKIYIIIMSAFCLLCLVFILYNFYTLSQYKVKLKQGESQLEKILQLEAEWAPVEENTEQRTIPDVYQFFKRKARNIEEPEVEESSWEPGSQNGISFAEKRYTIRFEKGISRRDLCEYIHSVISAKPFLKMKELDLKKVENTSAYEEIWTAEIVFAYREVREQD